MNSEDIKLLPVQVHERITVLDALRGFALFGILIVNLGFFSYPVIYLELAGVEMWAGVWDRAVNALVKLLFEGKFYSMFSFLFGLGFIVFMERAEKKVRRPLFLFFRRLFVLLIIGLAHAFLLWFGDILVFYAVLGFLLPLFYRLRSRTILVWVVALMLISLIPVTLSLAFAGLAGEEQYAAYMEEFIASKQERAENSITAYGQGTFSEVMAQRTSDVIFTYKWAVFAFPLIIPMFLLGVYAGKRRLFHDLAANIPFIRQVWWWSLVIGLGMSVVKYASGLMVDARMVTAYDLTAMVGRVLGDPALSIFYMTSLILLTQQGKWLNMFAPLACAGRMALSNYLFQSFICTTIFYSYGLGLYGKVGPAAGFLLSLLIFSTQAGLSALWLKKYRYGPAEWFWRTLTYGRLRI